jgi:hypothetical protein
MNRYAHPAALAATAIVSLAIGFGAASLLPSRAVPIEPIIDSNAWEEAAPAALSATPASMAARPVRSETCSAWEISDVAMEEVLGEMIRRGWRPPNQGDAIAAMDLAQTVGLSATDPNAPMPYRRAWYVSDQPRDEKITAPEEATGEAPADEPALPAEPEPPTPPPA